MPRVGETWRTRVGPYTVRLIADDARGNYPLVGLIQMGDRDVAWNFDREGGTRDPYDNGFDLVERIGSDFAILDISQLETVGGEHD